MRNFFKSRPPLFGKWRAIRPRPIASAPAQAGRTNDKEETQESDIDQIETETEIETEAQETEEQESKFQLPDLPKSSGVIPNFRQIDNTIVREFASWWDFITCASDETLRNWFNPSIAHSRSKQSQTGFAGTETFDQAVDMAINTGWPEGRNLIYDSFVALPRRHQIYKSAIYEVAGPIPIVPVYVTGDPACMQDYQPDFHSNNPIVKIDCSIVYGVSITQQTCAQRGAAMLSLANTLEEFGYSVELNIVCRVEGTAKTDFYSRVAFKAAGEQFDLDRAAFALAHTSTLRRFMGALFEQHQELKEGFYSHWGYPNNSAFAPLMTANTIFLPAASRNETLAESRMAVEQAAKSFFDQNPSDERSVA